MKLKSVLRVTIIYLIFGLLWIYFSDMCIDALYKGDVIRQSQLQTLKGFFYVGFTSLLLYSLVKKYNKEIIDKLKLLRKSEAALRKSEEDYKTLFESSPMPVFIYQPDTEKILAVNNAAVIHYGYSAEEFSTLSLAKISDEARIDMRELEQKLNIPKREGLVHATGIHRHKKKDGSLIYIYTQSNVIHYRGEKALVVIANDITQQLQYIDAIEKQNEKLNDISWQQSHVIRAPLASLMGLVHLLKDYKGNAAEQQEVLDKILSSATEVDNVIKNISGNSASVNV